MPLFQRRSFSLTRRVRPHAPSCRSGASSMLRLAQPVSPMAALMSGMRHSAHAIAPSVTAHDDFAPSRWLVGR